jgi:general secretion pathway protein L
VAGSRGWVAVTHRPWLAAALGALESAGLSVERVVVAGSPAEAAAAPPRGHFFTADDGPESTPWLALTQAEGAVCLHLSGALARALRPPAGPAMRWTASPAAAAQAERWLGQPVALMTDAERALEAAAGTLNLRQFDLGARHRGTRALRDLGKRFLSAEWRAVRTGLVALLLLQLIGLNAQAWQQGQALAERRRAMTELLRQTHPGVRAVLDAPLQMQRETDRLRSAAGRPGEQDLEALMAAAASAWPDGQGPAPSLRFEAGRLTLGAAGWEAPQLQQFRQRLKGAGYAAESAEGRVTVARAPGGAGAAP